MENRLHALLICMLAGGVALALAAGCGGESGSDTVSVPSATAGAPLPPESEQPLSAAEAHGRELFVARCGTCHTLDSAGTVGQIGPNLDDIPITYRDVLHAIRIGGGPDARGNRPGPTGNMPRNIYTGKDAKDVARFVAATASNPSAPG